jgi:hypothetical protein
MDRGPDESAAMQVLKMSVVVIAVALCAAACERKVIVVEVPATPIPEPVARTKTLETSRLGEAVNAYERTPSTENLAAAERALHELDGEIAELEALVAKRRGSEREEAAVKLKNLRTYRAGEVARLTAAQPKAPLTAPSPTAPPSADGRTGAEKAEDAAKRVGERIDNAARQTGDAIKDAVR